MDSHTIISHLPQLGVCQTLSCLLGRVWLAIVALLLASKSSFRRFLEPVAGDLLRRTAPRTDTTSVVSPFLDRGTSVPWSWLGVLLSKLLHFAVLSLSHLVYNYSRARKLTSPVGIVCFFSPKPILHTCLV